MNHKKFPSRITLELTNCCNLRCSFCPRHFMDYPLGYMKDDLFKKLIDEMVAKGCTTLVPFFRGEPLLHKNCLPLLAYAKNKGCEIQFTTNAALLDSNTSRELVSLGIDFVSLSLDSIDPDEYNKRRLGADFKKMMAAVDNLLHERGKQEKAMCIQVSAVDTGMDWAQKKQFTSYWNKRADRVRIYPQHTQNGKFGSLSRRAEPQRRPCRKPFDEMVIYWDGQAAICNHDWNRCANLGNARNSCLEKIWTSSVYSKLRQAHESCSFFGDHICGHCDHWLQYCDTPQTIGEIIS